MPHSTDNEMPSASLVNGEMLYPTTMHGTRPEIAITYSPANKARQEAEYFAGLSYWGKLRYRLFEFLRRQAY